MYTHIYIFVIASHIALWSGLSRYGHRELRYDQNVIIDWILRFSSIYFVCSDREVAQASSGGKPILEIKQLNARLLLNSFLRN